MPVIEAAMDLLAAGYVPLPLFPGKKHIDVEAMGRKAHHFRTRSKQMKNLVFASLTVDLADFPPSVDEVNSWFHVPGHNIGLIGGFENLAILDFDDLRSFERFSAISRGVGLNPPIASTPDGMHVYVRTSAPMISSSLYSGLTRVGHVKALGGYVVCPPSRLAGGGKYEWAKGRSVFDCKPPLIADMADFGLSAVHPVKRWYDTKLGRGDFIDR